MPDEKTEAADQQQSETLEPSEFGSLLQKEFKPKSDRKKEAIQIAIQTLAEQVLADTAIVSDDIRIPLADLGIYATLQGGECE